MSKYASDLHRKGELEKVEQMEKLQKKIEKETNSGLAGAFFTNGYRNKYDVIGMMAQSPKYSDREGYIFYDEEEGKAVFIKD